MDKQTENNNKLPLKPHRYPLVIVVTAIIIFLLFLYSLISLVPKYSTALKYLNAGREAYGKEEWQLAADMYREVLSIIPSSEDTKIELARTLFANNTPDDDFEALILLEGIELNTTDWKKLEQVLPKEFVEFFTS